LSQNDNKEYGSTKTEAWADSKEFDPETNVNKPSINAVEDAKEWVEDNEK